MLMLLFTSCDHVDQLFISRSLLTSQWHSCRRFYCSRLSP